MCARCLACPRLRPQSSLPPSLVEQGIGASIALGFAKHGANIVIAGALRSGPGLPPSGRRTAGSQPCLHPLPAWQPMTNSCDAGAFSRLRPLSCILTRPRLTPLAPFHHPGLTPHAPFQPPADIANEDKAAEVVQAVESMGRRATFVQCDVRRRSLTDAAVLEAVKKMGVGPDILVASAGAVAARRCWWGSQTCGEASNLRLHRCRGYRLCHSPTCACIAAAAHPTAPLPKQA